MLYQYLHTFQHHVTHCFYILIGAFFLSIVVVATKGVYIIFRY